MSVGTQIISVEKLIAKSLSNVMDLKVQAVDWEESGLDATALRARLSDVEATLQYLNDILEALQVAVPAPKPEAESVGPQTGPHNSDRARSPV
jgi:hypothetical protein